METKSEHEILCELAAAVMRNNQEEASATEGYTQLCALICKARDATQDPSVVEVLDRIALSIDEIIADELDHSAKLNRIYSIITGIQPGEENR